jgi:GDP-D-mannose 3', 5'-epimerase
MHRERDESCPQGLVVVAGGGGFIGGHVVAELLAQGYSSIRAVDIKPVSSWFQVFPQVANLELDLMDRAACREAMTDAQRVFNFAADMGGMGFIETNKALCMLSSLINTQLLLEAWEAGVERYFFASSACVYAAEKQVSTDVAPLREADAYPAMPEDGYGWEKLFGERMCRHFTEDFGIQTRVARYHNVYGPNGTFAGGREKAPAAICRKLIEAKLSGKHEIEIWGDGEQTRSFMFIDDCVQGTLLLMESGVTEPLNIGSDRLVTINEVVSIVEDIAGLKVRRRYDRTAPQGVRGRNSDNTLVRAQLGWEPTTSLEQGLEQTYRWIYDQMSAEERASQVARGVSA